MEWAQQQEDVRSLQPPVNGITIHNRKSCRWTGNGHYDRETWPVPVLFNTFFSLSLFRISYTTVENSNESQLTSQVHPEHLCGLCVHQTRSGHRPDPFPYARASTFSSRRGPWKVEKRLVLLKPGLYVTFSRERRFSQYKHVINDETTMKQFLKRNEWSCKVHHVAP